MHRCLCISEVLQVIADSLDNGHGGTLLTMALTCRTFFDPAMNALWRTLTDRAYVYLILPERIRTVTSGKRVTIHASPSKVEWQRVQDYARRVRHLKIEIHIRPSNETFSHSICPLSVWRYCPEGHLFPNLRSFTANDGRDYAGDAGFVRPPLRSLIVRFSCISHVEPIMYALPSCSQTLEVLSLNLPESLDIEDEVFEEELSDAVSQLRVLKSLTIGVLFPPAITQLATLSTLHELQFTLETVGSAATTLPFPSLRHLTIKYSREKYMNLSMFLQRVAAPVLEQVVLNEKDRWQHIQTVRPTAASMSETIHAMEHLQSLRSLVYDTTWSLFSEPVRPEEVLSLSTLAPLLTMRNLNTLDIRALPFALVSADIQSIAHAWPHLRYLRLGDTASGYQPQDYLRIEDLLPFTEKCPQLRTLGLPLCIPRNSAQDAVPLDMEMYSLLSELHVLRVDAQFSREVVQMLAELFPEVIIFGGAPREVLERLNNLVFKEVWGLG